MDMTRPWHRLLGLLLLAALPQCGGEDLGTSSEDTRENPLGEGTPEALAVLTLVNDRTVLGEELDVAAALDARAAAGIIAHREGPDGVQRTADDDLYDTVAELDAVPNVGPATLLALLAYAKSQGYYDAQLAKRLDVVFSPLAYADSHLPLIAQRIDQAGRSIDIAMYSFSDAAVSQALARAVERGVQVRFVFETAGTDKSVKPPALANTKSAALEKIGVNVRWVSKVMHHKFMIVDGPRDQLESAASAVLVTGSGNWSNGAATKYDENTLFLSGYPELTLRLQREFNLLWEHSGDLAYDPALPYELSTLAIGEEILPEDPGSHVFFTSTNFNPNGTTFSALGTNEVADKLVAAIQGATKSIHVASGHLRSRPVAEALMAKVASSPGLDVRILLDGQEYISKSTNDQQVKVLDVCLAAAGSNPAKTRACLDRGFYYGYNVGRSGALVRYKYYAYRWETAYALQMHNKVMIVDGDELYTGSYNLSDNAEHNTFENMFLFRGPEFQSLVATYEATFETLWEMGRAEGRLQALTEQVKTASEIPLVFDPMALEWQEVSDLKTLIRQNCPVVDSTEYRTNALQHLYCPR
jgi:phosphatidylserine/phosphatidylglycerophosphate/cardiolipin synthase-like enzyme